MSSEITNLIAYVGSQGVQDTSRFSVQVNGKDITKSVISVKLPGPKIEFLKLGYWSPNPDFYFPFGLKYPDSLILEMLVPESSEFNPTHGNFYNNLQNYLNARFSSGNRGVFFGNNNNNLTPFLWNRPAPSAENNDEITVTAYNRSGGPTKTYVYFNCFMEKILPIEFDTSKADVQTFSAVFVVGGMKNKEST
jgi:hypothetical protein